MGLGQTSLSSQIGMNTAGRTGCEREAEGAGRGSKPIAGLELARSSAELWKALYSAVSR